MHHLLLNQCVIRGIMLPPYFPTPPLHDDILANSLIRKCFYVDVSEPLEITVADWMLSRHLLFNWIFHCTEKWQIIAGQIYPHLACCCCLALSSGTVLISPPGWDTRDTCSDVTAVTDVSEWILNYRQPGFVALYPPAQPCPVQTCPWKWQSIMPFQAYFFWLHR